MRCPYCNTPILDSVKACPHCGRPLARMNQAPKAPAGRALGQSLQPVHIDEDVYTVRYSNSVAEKRNRAGNWFRPIVAFGMALASVIVMMLIAQSSISQIIHIGDTAGQQQSEQAQAGPEDIESEDVQDNQQAITPSLQNVNDEQAQAQTPPVFTEVEASTVLTGDSEAEGERYKAENVLDRSVSTAWNEGSPGDGVGEWIEVKAIRPQHVKGIRICAGFASDDGTYYNNSRPSAVTITFDDHTSVDMELGDLFAQYQTLDLEQPKDTTSIRVTVKSIYPGNAYSDCCIAEVQAY